MIIKNINVEKYTYNTYINFVSFLNKRNKE